MSCLPDRPQRASRSGDFTPRRIKLHTLLHVVSPTIVIMRHLHTCALAWAFALATAPVALAAAPGSDLSTPHSTAAQGASGARQPAATGDLREKYAFPLNGRILHYRLYLPSRYDGSRALPLVVVLHGYMGNENSAFDEAPAGLHDILQREAEHHGFIVLSPAGYDGRGDYGAHLALPVHAGVHIVRNRHEDDLAEADVLDVIRRVESSYRADRRRVYLMGNSMGMTGTLYLAQKFPHMWCAIGPSDGPPWPDYPVLRLRALSGAIFVNGDRDTIALTAGNRELAARVRAAGVDTRFVEVPDGTHASAWYLALPQIFAFFAAHDCSRVNGRGAP
ncbi:MAG: alpha/beta hydrolase-fold protein [Steroidobacteraceae bacterium]